MVKLQILKIEIIYWVIPLLLFGVQVVFTYGWFEQLRYEEVGPSIRETFWFYNRELYSPAGSQVGWYGITALLYNIFGFYLYLPRIYRLFLQLIVLYVLAAILRKYLGYKTAIIPLLTIGLSPTWLYYNTLQNPYGTDLQYFTISLFLITHLGYAKKWISLVQQGAAWSIAMLGWMTYPVFVLYLPVLGVLTWYNAPKTKRLIYGAASFAAFLLPLVLIVAYMRKHFGILYDPVSGRGIFTAGGGLQIGADVFANAVVATFTNFFLRSTTYYLELVYVEFSHALPLIALTFIFISSVVIFKRVKNLRLVIMLCWLVVVINLLLISITLDSAAPGGRRNTPMLAAFYGLYIVVWYVVIAKKMKLFLPRFLITTLLAIFLLHHLIVLPFNYYFGKQPSQYAYKPLFDKAESYEQSLKTYIDAVQSKDIYVSCEEYWKKGIAECAYSISYAVIKGSCMWNKLSCHDLYTQIPGRGVQKLTFDMWLNSDFEK